MKKRLTIISSAILSAVLFATGVYASRDISSLLKAPINSETSEIQQALDNSGIIRSRYNIISTTDNDTDVQRQNQANATEDVETARAENALRLYDVQLSENLTSIASQLDKENERWLLPKIINGKMTYSYIRKGRELDVVIERVKKLNISEEWKENMIARAAEKEGKWYVYRLDTIYDSDTAAKFVNNTEIAATLNSNNVTNIQDMKYIYIKNNSTLGIWIQTDSGEYIIPYVTSPELSDLVSNSLYTMSDVVRDSI